MNPRERLLTTIRGGEADRVPLVLPGFEFQSRAALEAHPDPLRREVARRVFDAVAFRLQVPSYVNRYLVTPPQRITSETCPLPNGHSETQGVIDTPKGELTFITRHDPVSDTTWQVKYPVESMEEIEKIASVPWERPEGLSSTPLADRKPADFARRGILETRISSPFVCVSGMMRYEWFLALTLTEPDLIAELTEICRQRILDVLHVLLAEPGIEYVWIGGSEWVTPPMASPATYDALVQAQERSLIDYIHRQGNILVHVHCHGNVRHALPRTIERGGDYTEPVEPPPDGDITMAEAKAVADGRITLGGNIECRVLANESEEAVEAAVHAAFEGGKHRFVLRPTEGPSPRLSEREFHNYICMVDVWEALSPISPSPRFGEGD
jgi:hypothetical protein